MSRNQAKNGINSSAKTYNGNADGRGVEMMYTRIATLCVFLLLSINLLAQTQIINTYAGGGPNNMPALSANLFGPNGVAVDVLGNYYVAIPGQNRIFKVDPAGNLTVVAGNGTRGFSGDGGAGDERQPNIHS